QEGGEAGGVLAAADDVADVDGSPVDGDGRPSAGGTVEVLEEVVGSGAVSAAHGEPAEVDQRLDGELGGVCGERRGGGGDVELSPAQGAREVGHAAVAGDERRLVLCLGGDGQARREGPLGRGSRQVGYLADAVVEPACGGTATGHEREPPGRRLTVHRHRLPP